MNLLIANFCSSNRLVRTLCVSLSLVSGLFVTAAIAGSGTGSTIPLSDTPLFSPTSVPGNVLLTLSVEYPTALSEGNSAKFNPATTTYIGYFDPNLCYTYVYDSTVSITNYFSETGDDGDYFKPTSRAGTNATCSGQWSGAFLNWATMQTIDPFRWALTGGFRSVDTPTKTILKKAWASGDGGSGEFQNSGSGQARTWDPSINIQNYIPFATSTFQMRIWGLGTRMEFTATAPFDGNNQSVNTYTAANAPDIPWDGTFSNLNGANLYSLKVRVLACDNSFDSTYSWPAGSITTCTQYSQANKPEGLIQQYSTPVTAGTPPAIRFGAMGYLNDNSIFRDAGVLRARMNFLGPIAPTPGNPSNPNPLNEWDGTTGVYTDNSTPNGPDPLDVAATNAANTCSPSPCAAHSGVIAYLNGFGEITHSYKTYDPVNELYYAAIRYFRGPNNTGGGNVVAWSCLKNSGAGGCSSTSPAYTGSSLGASQSYKMIDQFPVIGSDGSQWDDPIIYACQKNYILGIGDVNAHAGGNVAGSPKGSQLENSTTYEPTTPQEVANDSSVNAVNATNYIGTIEGSILGVGSTSTLGKLNYPYCCSDDNNYLMAGLAYDSHVKDMRPGDFTSASNLDGSGNKIAIQTVSTYWLDVQENQTYRYQNMFWLAAKYGGFVLPTATNPSYSYTAYQASAFPDTSWTSTTHTDLGQPGINNASQAHEMPNNYYGASSAQAMVQGLTSAFTSIAAGASQITTGLAASSYNPVGASFGSYAVKYNPADWTSTINAYTTTFDANDNAINTPLWDGGLGSAAIVTGYNIVGPPPSSVNGQFSGNGWDVNRRIATWNGLAGVPFRVPDVTHLVGITTAQQTALKKVLGTNYATGGPTATAAGIYLNYLRGYRCDEQGISTAACLAAEPTPVGFRPRDFLQGDVVNSQLVPVGAPDLLYTDVNDPGYPAFSAAQANRQTVIYVGANDGMLHAYDGSATPFPSGTGGTELFAYVPSQTFNGPTGTPTDAGLAALGDPAFVHHFYVDATPIITDVDLNNVNRLQTLPPLSSHAWTTLLVGGMGKGGRSYFALDVTNPATVAANETNLASAVKWEFTDPKMGYSYGPALIAKTKVYGWTVILTSGMNAPTDSSNGVGTFYLVNPSNGTLYTSVSTGQGSTSNPAGLAYATGIALYVDGTIDAVYAGDLLGNLWRLDLTGTTSPTSANLLLFAKLTDSAGNPQPISSAPLVAVDPNTNNRYVMVGTGKLLSQADLTTTTQQTFYSFADGTLSTFLPASNTYFPIQRSDLISDNLSGATYTQSVCGVGVQLSGVTINSGKKGWLLDLSPANATAVTCRVNIAPVTGPGGTVVFAANLPKGDVCNPSGTNETFVLLDGTGVPENIDPLTGLTTSFGSTLSGGVVTSLTGYNNGQTYGTTPTGPVKVPAQPPGNSPLNRLNWREIPSVD